MNNMQNINKSLIVGIFTLLLSFVFWSFSTQIEPKDKDLIVGTWVEYDPLKEDDTNPNQSNLKVEFSKDGFLKTYHNNKLIDTQKYVIEYQIGGIKQYRAKYPFLKLYNLDTGKEESCFGLDVGEEAMQLEACGLGKQSFYKKYKN